jgi:hypothetical protein
VGKSVVFDGAPDCRSYRGELVVGEVNCRHGSDIIGRHWLTRRLSCATLASSRRRPKAICGLQTRASAVCRPLLSRGGGRQGRQLACGTVSPARPASPCGNSHRYLRRRANDLHQTRALACLLRPIFCAFAPFPATRAPAARPPRAQERAARTHRGIRSRARPASLQARVSRTRTF